MILLPCTCKLVLWQLMILLPCTPAHMSSIPMGAVNFYMQECFFTLADVTFIPMFAMYLPTRMFCTLTLPVCLLFPWVQCQSLKPVLSQCSQTGFVTVDDFIPLYTRSYIIYSHGCNKFLHATTFFTLADMIVLTEVWPPANRAMVTNN